MNSSQVVEWTVEGMRGRFEELSALGERQCGAPDPLEPQPFCQVEDAGGGQRTLRVFLSRHFLRAVVKGRLQRSALLWKALLNVRYGYEPARGNSPGGRDGIFRVTSDFRPANEMQRKLYDGYLERPEGREELRRFISNVDEAHGVRVVSHGLRLLGFVEVPRDGSAAMTLVLVDVDVNKR